MERWELFLGLVALVAAFWQQAKRFLEWVKSWVIVSRKTDWQLGALLLSYAEATMRMAPVRGASYASAFAFVRPLERVYRVIFQTLSGSRQTFWRRGRPLWYTPTNIDNSKSGPGRDFTLEFSYLRGTFDWDKLLLAAAAWEDEAKHGLGKQTTRYRVLHHYGTLGTAPESLAHGNKVSRTGSEPCSPESDWNGPQKGVRLLEWSFEDIQGAQVIATMDNLSLRPELTALVDELKHWHSSEQWYRSHGVPWRRGCMLYGGPGTGKTSFARAVAELLDMPVHVFDLGSMSNQDLKYAWRDMLTTSPCIALLEDLDAVFQGRVNVAAHAGAGGTPVSFDALLNCIDGIERVDGMLLIVTTNCLDKMDPALVSRPGRIDSVVEFLPLDHDGRVKLATRILDSVELAVQIAKEGANDSAASFQERCFRLALSQRFPSARAAS